MKKIEFREVSVWYCDICGEECGLPYSGFDTIGYGKCCDGLMRKLQHVGALEELRDKVPTFGDFYNKYEAAVKARKELADK